MPQSAVPAGQNWNSGTYVFTTRVACIRVAGDGQLAGPKHRVDVEYVEVETSVEHGERADDDVAGPFVEGKANCCSTAEQSSREHLNRPHKWRMVELLRCCITYNRMNSARPMNVNKNPNLR